MEEAKAVLRTQVPFYDKDRYFAPDIEKAANLIRDGRLDSMLANRFLM